MRRAPARADVVAAVRSAVARGDLETAEQLAREYQDESGATPEALDASSWVARGLLKNRLFAKAAGYAKQIHRVAARRLAETALDSDPHLAAALGASVEVIAQAATGQGDRAGAVRFLKRELARTGTAPIHPRIRKNLNLLTLTGQPAPELEITEWLGPKPQHLKDLRGRPVLLFLCAHYCEDSRAQGRVLARIQRQFAPRGLVLVGPTRRYGYFDEHRAKPADPVKEKQHISHVLRTYYAELSEMPVPISESNLVVYGVSTTPTLVLINTEGVVSSYHPGKLPYTELASQIRDVLRSS